MGGMTWSYDEMIDAELADVRESVNARRGWMPPALPEPISDGFIAAAPKTPKPYVDVPERLSDAVGEGHAVDVDEHLARVAEVVRIARSGDH